MMHTITLKYLKIERNSSMTNPFIERILSQDKTFCCITLGSTFSLVSWKPGGHNRTLYIQYTLIVRLKFLNQRVATYSKSMVKDLSHPTPQSLSHTLFSNWVIVTRCTYDQIFLPSSPVFLVNLFRTSLANWNKIKKIIINK